jgi:DNA-binding response OmpR family regulator
MMLGIRNYIIKPIDPENLMAKIRRLLKISSS